jgi:hypothetical protein
VHRNKTTDTSEKKDSRYNNKEETFEKSTNTTRNKWIEK